MKSISTMKRLLLTVTLLSFTIPGVKADEGMWLLPYLKQQNYKKMVDMGLKLKPEEIYNPQGSSLMDAVIQFDNGCTGEVVSDQGLFLTNHHCGYGEIQSHSTLEHNLLRDGFFAPKMSDELPNPGLTVTFTEDIVELTDYVNEYLKAHNETDPMNYMSRKYLERIAEEWYTQNRGAKEKGIVLDLAPFYEGNRFILYVRKRYHDIRLVAAPPSCIGKFGADTDNWVWPRHSGDFCVFRIYTAPDGSPAEYSPSNIPLKPKRHLQVTTEGVQEGSFVMIMGFPGSTYHFYTADEVAERRDIDNKVRIEMREVRQNVMQREMLADEAVNIKYAAKYAGSTNAYKNAIGTNWAIDMMDFEGIKRREQESLEAYGKKVNKPEYAAAIATISDVVKQRAPLRRQIWMLNEGLRRSLEIAKIPLTLNKAEKLQGDRQALENYLQTAFTPLSKDYDAAVDRKVTEAVLLKYLSETAPADRPTVLQKVTADEAGVKAYVENLFGNTMLLDGKKFMDFLTHPDHAKYAADPAVVLARDINDRYLELQKQVKDFDKGFADARHTYLKGRLEMEGEENLWPDANLTLRYTFGQVKGYSPRDQVYYGPRTTMEGVMEKEDPTNPEYTLLPKVKELYHAKDFGPYAREDGRMPVNFCATTHTTGGNSGSPVINGKGQLVGINFDRNWEGVGGDIEYLPDYQRGILVDIRYVLFILDKYLGADRLIREMNVAH